MSGRFGALSFDYTSGPQRISDEIKRMRSEEEDYKRFLFQQESASPRLKRYTLAVQGFGPGEVNAATENLKNRYKQSPEYTADFYDANIPEALKKDYQMFLGGATNKLEAIDRVLTKYIRRGSLDPILQDHIRNLMSYRKSIESKYRREGAFQPAMMSKS